MILDIETTLLDAVRTHLMEVLSLSDDSIDIELDDIAPAMTGDLYYCISPANGTVGKHNMMADQSFNYVYGCRVAVIQRITQVARDRRRSVFHGLSRTLNSRLSEVERAIRFNSDILCAATKAIKCEHQIEGGFTHPLVVQSFDQKPRTVNSDLYGSRSGNNGGEKVAAMVRGINFGGADFIGKRV